MIVFYSKSCEGCSGNKSLAKMKSRCKLKDVEFETRRTILWKRYEEEADRIMEVMGVELPFFYSTEAEVAMEGDSFTTLDDIDKLIKLEKEANGGSTGWL